MTNPTAMAAVEKMILDGYFNFSTNPLTPERVIDKVIIAPTNYGKDVFARGFAAINTICLLFFENSNKPESFFTVLDRSFFENNLELSISGDEFMGIFNFVYGI